MLLTVNAGTVTCSGAQKMAQVTGKEAIQTWHEPWVFVCILC